MNNNLRIGLDIGIGSIGWCVITGKRETAKIEDFGVRIFDSGEIDKYGKKKSQVRRGFRAVRRLTRRRTYRKMRIKELIQSTGLVNGEKIVGFFEKNSHDIYELRAKGTKERLRAEELAACLIHACNHRGYRDFYDEAEKEAVGSYQNIVEPDGGEGADQEETANKQALAAFDRLYIDRGSGTVSAFIVQHFKNEKDKFPNIRNRETSESRYLIRREYIREEINEILHTQAMFYPVLTQEIIDRILKIIFSQRDFEDGPGNPHDHYRRYQGFLNNVGKCMFYREQNRGFRSTVMADIFAVTNTLSQYRYVNKNTGELSLTKEAANEIIQYLLQHGNLTMTDVKKILKAHQIQLLKSDNSDDKALSKSIKYLRTVKKSIDDAGLDWQEFVAEPQLDCERFSRLHKLGEVISRYHTPARRRKELAKLGFVPDKLVNTIVGKKISGTSNVCYQYMGEAAQAFLNGEIYGNFQAARMQARRKEAQSKDKQNILLALLEDEDVKNNPVVFRAINETRKVINEIIRIYGSPECINVEVASDLNRSYLDRQSIKKRQEENERRTAAIKKHIAELLAIHEDEVRGVQIDKYKLYEEQGGKCLYSGIALGDLQEVLADKAGRFEIDHVVPYSLILDNTLNNKALVYAHENQLKRQRTPLMYLVSEKRETFLSNINVMYSRREKQISKKKYQYLKLESLYGKEAEELLRNWKSRNINDTRYITRYIVAYLKGNLLFSGKKETPVYGIKGSLTSRFRKIWLNKKTWGCEEKDRDRSHLHHAADAVVIANLTPEYVEIASDNIKLQQIYRRNRNTTNSEYQDYLARCIKKMKKYYGFNEDYARELLTRTQRVPSYVPNLSYEVEIRFNDHDEELWQDQVEKFYRNKGEFIRPPRMPLVSYKQERKFRGAIADSNPIRVCEVNGVTKKIKRVKIQDITRKHLENIRTGDKSLVRTLNNILGGKDDKYTVGKYLKDNGLSFFQTDKGQRVNKISLIEKTVSNFYRKEIGENNFSMVTGLKYYCVEIYENLDGKTCTWGVNFVDAVKKDKKLRIRACSIPAGYGKHVMYLFPNEYIEITNKNGEIKFRGCYRSVYNSNENRYYCVRGNVPQQARDSFRVAKSDKVRKYHIDILGRKGGEVKCSVPLSLLKENSLD